jgi:hypothetical protein
LAVQVLVEGLSATALSLALLGCNLNAANLGVSGMSDRVRKPEDLPERCRLDQKSSRRDVQAQGYGADNRNDFSHGYLISLGPMCGRMHVTLIADRSEPRFDVRRIVSVKNTGLLSIVVVCLFAGASVSAQENIRLHFELYKNGKQFGAPSVTVKNSETGSVELGNMGNAKISSRRRESTRKKSESRLRFWPDGTRSNRTSRCSRRIGLGGVEIRLRLVRCSSIRRPA